MIVLPYSWLRCTFIGSSAIRFFAEDWTLNYGLRYDFYLRRRG